MAVRLAAGIGLLLGTASLQAQSVRGTLVDSTSGQPIPSAFVTLLNQQGVEVARTLTGAGGTFFLTAPLAGDYWLRSKRIGFRLTRSPPLALVDSQTVEYRLEVAAVPVELPEVIVRARPACGAKAADAATVAQLWEETREALAAVKWTQEQARLRYAATTFHRNLSPAGRRVLLERDSAWWGVGQRAFGSASAERLEREGYVVAAPGDSVDVYGPDADLLLGDMFVGTHCFSARDGGKEHPGLVGLAFEPAPERCLPDVAGVLWLERRTLELQSLDFTYTRLLTPVGGRVEFARLASGPWIVAHWWIRSPRLDPARRRPFGRQGWSVLGYWEFGGLVTSVESAGGRTEHTGVEAVLRGRVVDSTRGGMPLAGAALWLAGEGRAPADEAGRFEIRGPFDGVYGISFRHPRLDSLGITADERQVWLTRGLVQPLTLFVPPESEVVRRHCPKGLRPGTHVIVGWVRDSTLAPVPRAHVEARVPARGSSQTATANREGKFVICNTPAGAVRVSAQGGGAVGEVAIELLEGQVWVDGNLVARETGRVWRQDLVVRRPQ